MGKPETTEPVDVASDEEFMDTGVLHEPVQKPTQKPAEK